MNATVEKKDSAIGPILALVVIIGFAYFYMLPTNSRSPLPDVSLDQIPDGLKDPDFIKSVERVKENLNSPDTGKKAYVYEAIAPRDYWFEDGLYGYELFINNPNNNRTKEGEYRMSYKLLKGDLVKYGVATAQNQKSCNCDYEDFHRSVRARYLKKKSDLLFYQNHEFRCLGIYYKKQAHGVETWHKLTYFRHPDNSRRVNHILIKPPKK